jgi:diguanylate cyclase (GGDEF)-like protein
MDSGDLGSPPVDVAYVLPPEARAGPLPAAGIDWLPLATLILTADGLAIAVNGAWAALAHVSRGDSRGDGWLRALDPLDRQALRARLRLAAGMGEPGSADCRLAATGGRRWSHWWWRPGPDGRMVVCVAATDDDHIRVEDEGRRGTRGGLTRLTNHRQFLTLVRQALRRSDRTGALLAVVVLHLDGIADGAGHVIGNRVLGAAIGRVTGAIRSADVAARIGTGEFAVLCENLRGPTEADVVARRLREAVEQPFEVDGASHSLSVVTGIALASGSSDDAGTVVGRAGTAMHAARLAAGRQMAGSAVPDSSVPPGAAGPQLRRGGPGGLPADPGRSRASSDIDIRIELTTTVIRRISGVGLTLASAASLVDGPAAARVHDAVDELDALIRDIRASVFELLIPPSAQGEGARP